MNKKISKINWHKVDAYVCPLCDYYDLIPQGIVCASFNSKLEQLEEEDMVDW